MNIGIINNKIKVFYTICQSTLNKDKVVRKEVFYLESVLIVDDQPGIRLLLNELLQREGYAVRLAANGLQALQEVSKEQPDCILLDMKMAGMDGIEVLEKIMKSWPEIPVFMMTAYDELELIDEVLAMGALKYFTKPFDIFEVRDAINGLFVG